MAFNKTDKGEEEAVCTEERKYVYSAGKIT